MAHKRKLVIERKEVKERDEPAQPGDMTWRDWLLRRYARSWYWVGVIFLDIIIFLETQRSLGVDVMVSLAITAGAVIVEMVVFLRLWGRNAPLGPEDEDE